jgi:putative transposase
MGGVTSAMKKRMALLAHTGGYRRYAVLWLPPVWAVLRRQARDEGLAPVNAKRVYRVMSENSLLLLHDRPPRPVPGREHNGKVAVAQSDQRWCSDGFEFGCDNGETAGNVRAGLLRQRSHRLGGEYRWLRQFDRAGCNAEVGRKALRR